MKTNKWLIALLLVLLNFSCISFAKPSEIIYLIPADFTGGVIVVFNQPDGITPETDKDGTTIYRIPKDGLIKVKEPLKRAAHKFSYYFVDEKGNRTPIEYLYPRYYVRDRGDTTTKSFDTISEDETNNKIFAIAHTTSNFSIGGERVYVYNFLIEKPAIASRTLTQTEYKIFDIQKEMMRKEKAEKQQQ